jgi:hypothetical protein
MTDDAVKHERNLIVSYLFLVARHWREEARRLEKNHDAALAATAKCAVLEGVAADLQDGAHTRQP